MYELTYYLSILTHLPAFCLSFFLFRVAFVSLRGLVVGRYVSLVCSTFSRCHDANQSIVMSFCSNDACLGSSLTEIKRDAGLVNLLLIIMYFYVSYIVDEKQKRISSHENIAGV